MTGERRFLSLFPGLLGLLGLLVSCLLQCTLPAMLWVEWTDVARFMHEQGTSILGYFKRKLNSVFPQPAVAHLPQLQLPTNPPSLLPTLLRSIRAWAGWKARRILAAPNIDLSRVPDELLTYSLCRYVLLLRSVMAKRQGNRGTLHQHVGQLGVWLVTFPMGGSICRRLGLR